MFRKTASLVGVIAGMAIGVAVGGALPALDREAQGQGRYVPPRTPDGKPDLQGVWQVMNTADVDIQDHSAGSDGPAGAGVVAGNEIPYQPWALAKKKENYEQRATADPIRSCYLPGVPRAT